jgi:hypothetical protein
LDAGRSEQAGHGQGELGAEASWARLAGGELGAVGRRRAGRGRPGASSWRAAAASDCRGWARELLAGRVCGWLKEIRERERKECRQQGS